MGLIRVRLAATLRPSEPRGDSAGSMPSGDVLQCSNHQSRTALPGAVYRARDARRRLAIGGEMDRESRQNALHGESDCNEGDLPWTRPVLRRERWGAVPSLGRMALGGTTRRESAKRVRARPAKFRCSRAKITRGTSVTTRQGARGFRFSGDRADCTTLQS